MVCLCPLHAVPPAKTKRGRTRLHFLNRAVPPSHAKKPHSHSAAHAHPSPSHRNSPARHDDPPHLQKKQNTTIIIITRRKKKRETKTHQGRLESAVTAPGHVCVSQLRTRDRRAPARPLLRVRRAGICVKAKRRRVGGLSSRREGKGLFYGTDRVPGVALGGACPPL